MIFETHKARANRLEHELYLEKQKNVKLRKKVQTLEAFKVAFGGTGQDLKNLELIVSHRVADLMNDIYIKRNWG